MITAANYLLIAYVGGEQYHFEYEDCGDMWEALEQFWHEDWECKFARMEKQCFAVDVVAMDDGKAIKCYEVAFEMSYYHHFYDHGHITLNEFNDAIHKIRIDLDAEKKSKPGITPNAKDIIAIWSDWCMDWDDENLWLDYMVKHPKGHCNRQHLQEKWDYCYEKYGIKAAMTMFWRELDNDNRAILTEYITAQWHRND